MENGIVRKQSKDGYVAIQFRNEKQMHFVVFVELKAQ